MGANPDSPVTLALAPGSTTLQLKSDGATLTLHPATAALQIGAETTELTLDG